MTCQSMGNDISTFRTALKQLMAIRNVAKRYRREVYCHRNMASVQVMPNVYIQQAIQGLPIDDQRAVMQWLTRRGPFWEDDRLHGEDDWLECPTWIVYRQMACDSRKVTILPAWEMLANVSKARCTQLTFSLDCFKPLEGHPLSTRASLLTGLYSHQTGIANFTGPDRTAEWGPAYLGRLNNWIAYRQMAA